MSQTDGKFIYCGPHIMERNDIKRIVGDSHGVFAMVPDYALPEIVKKDGMTLLCASHLAQSHAQSLGMEGPTIEGFRKLAADLDNPAEEYTKT